MSLDLMKVLLDALSLHLLLTQNRLHLTVEVARQLLPEVEQNTLEVIFDVAPHNVLWQDGRRLSDLRCLNSASGLLALDSRLA